MTTTALITGLGNNLSDNGQGEVLELENHVRQSIRDILTTRLETRVMRPEYGSKLYRLVDNPVNAGWIARAVHEATEAIEKWEPRVSVLKIKPLSTSQGKVELEITFTLNGETLNENIEITN